MARKKILLLRHGQTDWNVKMRFQGVTDIPLNENGESQAKRVAPRISAWRPQRVFTSPLKRARRTAEIVTGRPELVTVLDELTEINFGVLEGKNAKLLREADPNASRWFAEPFSVQIKDAETNEHLFERVDVLLKKVVEADAERILLVGHAGIIRAIIARALKLPIASVWRAFAMKNCSLSGMIHNGNDFMLSFYNDALASNPACENQASAKSGVLPLGF